MNNPNGLAFYNGTAFPFIASGNREFPKLANQMLVDGLKAGISLQQQGEDYKKQMDLLEATLNTISGGEMVSQSHINRWATQIGRDEDYLMYVWYMDVIALEKLKIIKNDEKNGMMYLAAR